MPVQGTCLCGTVSYEVTGALRMMVHCHCSMCRKHHGSSFATFVGASAQQFRWLGGEDMLRRYQSSAQGYRASCRTCGSVAPSIFPAMDLAMLPAGNLEGDLGIKPQCHVFVGSKGPWHTITDDLPQYAEYPPEVGIPGITRPTPELKAGTVGGSCLCGAVAFELTGPALRMMNCHCSRCRRARSAAHATNLFYPLDVFKFTRGAQQVSSYKVPDAKYFATGFCVECGGAAPRISPERNAVVVPAGILDVDPGMRPAGHIYVGYKAPWFEITDHVRQYSEGP